MKTLLYTILLVGWDIRNQLIFHSKVIKNHACNPNMFVDASNDRTYQKVIQNGLQRETPKSIKNHKKMTLGLSRVPLSASVTHLIAKRCQNCAQGLPNGAKMLIRGP